MVEVADDFDVAIAGGGIGALTAAVHSARLGRSTLLLGGRAPGGLLLSIERIDGVPGFPEGVAGYELCPTLQEQAADDGAEIRMAELEGLEPAGKGWRLATSDGDVEARAVILATGARLRTLGVAGEERLRGHGVSHCASCDGPLYDGQVVGVVGGGDSALQEALTLANFADQVLLFHDSEKFSAQHSYQQRVLDNSKIIPRHQTVVEEILGDDVVTGVRVRNSASGEVSHVDLAGLFIYVGLQPNTEFLRSLLNLSETGHVSTDASMKTARDGLYAVGDIRQDSASQAITSAGDGATAAIASYRYVKETFR